MKKRQWRCHNMGTIDASQCWRIMPFSRFDGSGNDWWILGPDHQPVNTGFVLTKEEAYGIALEHNKKYGVNAVYVHRECMRKGGWEQPPPSLAYLKNALRTLEDLRASQKER
ncbi:MAG TPA: hypothetical protein VGJ66_01720 [Pyrinomonadaceae bacterium]|jgi:hypothetical protein